MASSIPKEFLDQISLVDKNLKKIKRNCKHFYPPFLVVLADNRMKRSFENNFVKQHAKYEIRTNLSKTK